MAYQKTPFTNFRVAQKDYESLFTAPGVPEQAADRLKAAGVYNKGGFNNRTTRTLDQALHDVDRASRAGLKFASALLLVADVVSRAYRNPRELGISRKDGGAIVSLLGPLSRLVYDQLARVAVRSTTERRSLVVESIPWATPAIKSSFSQLPLLGKDLFAGKFDEHLQSQATKAKALKEADVCVSKPRQSDQSRRFPSTSKPSTSTATSQGSSKRWNPKKSYSKKSDRPSTKSSYRPYHYKGNRRDNSRGRGGGRGKGKP